MALKMDAKFEGKLTGAFKNNMRNLANLNRLEQMNNICKKTFYTCLTELLFLEISYK